MHSSHFPGVTPCSCNPRRFICVLTALTGEPGHNMVHYFLWFLFGHDDPGWCSPAVQDVDKECGNNVSFHTLPLRGTLLLCLLCVLCSFSSSPHSWSSLLLSCNCSSVLGNRGRKSQSFHRATMTIKKKKKKIQRWGKEEERERGA